MDDYLEKLDSWLDGDDDGVAPIDVLRERGVDPPPPAALSDEALHAELWKVLRALPEIGFFISSTDHLSDRELYTRLVTEVLVEPTFLMPDNPNAFSGYDMSEGADQETWLTYYADDEERARWRKDFPEDVIPEKKPLPFDRDRLLVTIEQKIAMNQPAD